MSDRRRRPRIHPAAVGLGLLAVAWVIVTHFGLVGRTIVAGPGEVLATLHRALDPDSSAGRQLFLHAGATFSRALQGWTIALAAGLALGLFVGSRLPLALASEPVLELARAVPPVMVFPAFLIAFNYGPAGYVGTIVFGCLPTMILTVAQGKRSVSRAKLELLEVFAAGRGTRLLVTVMELSPSCILGARITLAMALIISVVTEMVFAPRSGVALGALAKEAEISFDTPLFYAALLVVGGFGYTANVLLRRLERWVGAKPHESLE